MGTLNYRSTTYWLDRELIITVAYPSIPTCIPPIPYDLYPSIPTCIPPIPYDLYPSIPTCIPSIPYDLYPSIPTCIPSIPTCIPSIPHDLYPSISYHCIPKYLYHLQPEFSQNDHRIRMNVKEATFFLYHQFQHAI